MTRDQSPSLVFKTFTGTATNIINYSVTKFIPLTIISIVSNLAPIVVVVLAFLILKEVIRKFDLAMMLLTLVNFNNCYVGRYICGHPWWQHLFIELARTSLALLRAIHLAHDVAIPVCRRNNSHAKDEEVQ